jgi:hypothetical protein
MVAVVLTIAFLTNINAVASPAFLNAKLVVVRAPDNSEVVQNSELRATVSPVSAQIFDQNPKLKAAMVGADASYEELKKVPEYFHTIPRDPAFEVQLTEKEATALISELNMQTQEQRVYEDYVVKFYDTDIEVAGSVYHIAITLAGK